MSSDLDQALLLYFDGQQAKTSIQEQQPRKPLNFCKNKVHYFDKCLVTYSLFTIRTYMLKEYVIAKIPLVPN